MKQLRAAALILVSAAAVQANASPPPPDRPSAVELPISEVGAHSEQPALATEPRFAALDAYLFPANESPNAPNFAGRRTDGIVVLQDGRIVHERYARGYGPDKKHTTWSVSKSVTGALTGIAIGQGKLKLDDSVCKYGFPYHCKLTVRHLMHWSSCLKWNEEYEGAETPANSDVLQMLYNRGSGDMANYVARQRANCTPGTAWRYSSGDSNLLSGVLKKALGNAYRDYPWKELFDKIGMSSATWEPDRSGTYVASSSVYATPRDLAKFGQLMLGDGVWNGTRILPAGWVTFLTEVAPAQRLQRIDGDESVSGAHWWVNKPLPEANLGRPWPDAPADTFGAFGHWGQSIVVIPSLRAVLVRTGDTRDGSFSKTEYLRLATRALEAK